MRAHCAAASSSALRMSGRRRSISAGTLDRHLARAPSGSPWGPPAARRRCPAVARAACSGRCAPAAGRSAAGGWTPGCSPAASSPGSTSSSEVAPLRKRDSAMSQRLLLKPGVLARPARSAPRRSGSRRRCARPRRSARRARSSSRPPSASRPAVSASTPRRYLPQKSSSQAASKPSWKSHEVAVEAGERWRRSRLSPTARRAAEQRPAAAGYCWPVATPSWARASTIRSPAICSGRFCR